jgi:isopentenyldiphosphate isomerase
MRHREPDPAEELFDVVDSTGAPTGQVKRRADVHRDGDWHCAFHCWVTLYLDTGEPAIVFQRRSQNKDTYPGRLDVAVGGHYRAGEGFDEVVREIEEELGIDPSPDSLVPVGRRWAEGLTDYWIDREIEDVYVHCLTEPVEILRPSFEEITALDVLKLSSIEDLFAGRTEEIKSHRYLVQPDNSLRPVTTSRVTLADFVPVTDWYWLNGSRAAAQVLCGVSDVRLDLGTSSR